VTQDAQARPQQKALMPARPDPNDLLGDNVVNTGPFKADGAVQKFYWANTGNRPVLIHMARIWLGCDGGLVCDADADLFRETDGARVATLQADHYQDGPHGAAHETFNFAPYYVALTPGERLVLTCWGNDYKGGKGNVHFAAFVWWRYGAIRLQPKG
jgi:hypothetical protein